MAIVDPIDSNQALFGKDYPTVGPFKSFKPNIVGPGSGKLKLAYYAAIKGGQYVWKNKWWFAERGGIVGAGALVAHESSNQLKQTLRQHQYSSYGVRRSRSKYNSGRCCCCRPKQRNRSSRRRFN